MNARDAAIAGAVVEAEEELSALAEALEEADRALARAGALAEVVNLGSGVIGEGRRGALLRALVAASSGLWAAREVLVDAAK